MSYFKMKRRIATLEKDMNDVDYPDSVMNNKKWSFAYLNNLYERSVNGARSPKAIRHLKKVFVTLYRSIAAACVLVAAVIVTIIIVTSHK